LKSYWVAEPPASDEAGRGGNDPRRDLQVGQALRFKFNVQMKWKLWWRFLDAFPRTFDAGLSYSSDCGFPCSILGHFHSPFA